MYNGSNFLKKAKVDSLRDKAFLASRIIKTDFIIFIPEL